MKRLKELLPRLLYVAGGLTILLAPVRFAAIFALGTRGYELGMSDWLNYGAAALTTCGTGLLYMAAARALELLERRNGGHS